MTEDLELRELMRLPDELLTALGHVSARCGQIEHILAMTIKRTDGISYDDAWRIIEELGYSDKKAKGAKRSFRHWAVKEFGPTDGEERADRFSGLVGVWRQLARNRHQVAHSLWSTKNGDLTATWKGKLLEWDGRPVAIADVERLAENLKQLVLHLNTATLRVGLSGPEDDIKSIPNSYAPDYVVPESITVESTAASTEIIAGAPPIKSYN